MVVSPEDIQVGKCYLADHRQYPQVWRVVSIFSDGRINYENRPMVPKGRVLWRIGMTTVTLFASAVSREVPCDWRPSAEGNGKP